MFRDRDVHFDDCACERLRERLLAIVSEMTEMIRIRTPTPRLRQYTRLLQYTRLRNVIQNHTHHEVPVERAIRARRLNIAHVYVSCWSSKEHQRVSLISVYDLIIAFLAGCNYSHVAVQKEVAWPIKACSTIGPYPEARGYNPQQQSRTPCTQRINCGNHAFGANDERREKEMRRKKSGERTV